MMEQSFLKGIEEHLAPAQVQVARQPASLQALPDELILGILRHVITPTNPGSLVCLSQTCKDLRRISQSVDFKDNHKWQIATLQSCWLSSTRGRCVVLAVITDHGLAMWLPPWFADVDKVRSSLGNLLRRDLFCAGCRSLNSRHGIYIPSSLRDSYLVQKRPCGYCPERPEHPVWQFLTDGTCLRTSSLIRLCPHQTTAAHNVWHTPSIAYTNCGECGSETTTRTVGCRWDSSDSAINLSTHWWLTQRENDTLFGSGLDGRQRATLLVDRFRLHERLYICPHHPIDGDRERCIAHLAPLVQGFQAELEWRDSHLLPDRHDFFVSHGITCAYCDVEVVLQGMRKCSVVWSVCGSRGDQIMEGLQFCRRYTWMGVKGRPSRPVDALYPSRSPRQPLVAPASLLAAVELPGDYPFARHPHLQHLAWCDDAACATNRRAAHLPVMLSRVTQATTSSPY
ncbi:hypothetical protein PG984_003083 [Apiospora sp. TS-2023a]